ncbi:hypothetical protein ACM44_10005 [Chryseobacterium koreense CCUG 49689]|uniref:Uncharacterized protein n=1 Tax=Chryseobacterium koreense CCUG 49689 TaxID=1304281 RepID=A0A0J7IYP9_9FLAO|nr:hypothetical protein ACM44_10005 [Chryseobacterium koreense CCUG 49689]
MLILNTTQSTTELQKIAFQFELPYTTAKAKNQKKPDIIGLPLLNQIPLGTYLVISGSKITFQ